jgi:L-glyceraldehyde reductase
VNQVEGHLLLPQDDLVKYCKKQGIHITAYSPLGNNREWRRADEKGERLRVSAAQMLVAWGVARGYSVIPKSVNKCK